MFEINGYLHQIPYTYYTQDGIADLPPGYENGNNTRFDREIGLECMSCHNAYSPHVEESRNKYHDISLELIVKDVMGQVVHVQRMLAGKFIDTSKYIDYSIVNQKNYLLIYNLIFVKDVIYKAHQFLQKIKHLNLLSLECI